MRKIFIITVLFQLLIIPHNSFAKVDNVYGEFLISKNTKQISMDLEEVSLMDLLKVLSQQSGLNFISTEAVQGRNITLYMEDVPLRDAMEIIFEANGLAYDFYPQAKLFVVKEMGKPSIELKTKIYKLKYVRVETSRLEEEVVSITGGEETDSSGSRAGQQEEGSSIKYVVQAVLTEAGKVIEERQTNSLIVIDVPSQFPIIDEVIKTLDVPQPKVLIEVEMLDVSKTAIDKLGVNWPQTIASLDVTGARVTRFPFWGPKANNDPLTFDEFDTPSGNWTFGAGLNANKFTPSIFTLIGAELAMDFLKTNADAKTLARPKLLTLSNETAEIQITTDEAIGIKKTESAEGGTTDFTIERAQTGTKLRVTPNVNIDTREITLVLEAVEKTATESGFVAATESFIAGTIKDPEERSTRTMVRLTDGQVLLIGGLIRSNETDNTSKVPFFERIPFLGALFRHKDKTTEQRELLVFLTPRIVEDESQFVTMPRMRPREQSMLSSKKEAMGMALDKLSHK